MTKNCKDFLKKYKIECQRSYVHSWNFHILLILSKYITVRKISCAHDYADIFYGLYVNEKMVENAKNQPSRVSLEAQKLRKSRKKCSKIELQ